MNSNKRKDKNLFKAKNSEIPHLQLLNMKFLKKGKYYG